MKKLLTTIIVLMALCLAFSFTACNQSKGVTLTDTEVIIKIDDDLLKKAEGDKLADYLAVLKTQNALDYTILDGMIIEVNGKRATYSENKSSWMLYTDDAENGNQAWGTYEYEGKEYLSATMGVADLPAKSGCTYILVVTQF